MLSFPTSPSLNVSTLQQRIKVIKEKNNISSIKCNTPRSYDSHGKVIEKLLQEGTVCGLLNEYEISTVENCYVKALKLVEHYKKAKKKRLSFKSKNINKNQKSENLQSTNERKFSMKDSFSPQCLLKNKTDVPLSFSEKDEVISVSDEDSSLPGCSESVGGNKGLKNIQHASEQNRFFKDSQKNQLYHLKNKGSKGIRQHISVKDADVIVISDADDCLPSSDCKLVKGNHQIKNIQLSCEKNNLLKDSLNLKEKGRIKKDKKKVNKSISQHCCEKDADIIAISDYNCLASNSKLIKKNDKISKINDKNVVYLKNVNGLNNNSALQVERYKLGCFSKRNKLKRKENFHDKFKRKEAALILNQNANKQFNKNIQNSDNDTLKTYNSDNKVITISDEIYNNGLDTSNHAFGVIEKNSPKKSLTNFEYEVLENDIAGNRNFQNNSEKLNMTQEPLEFIVPEFNLNKGPLPLATEIDMTKQIIGVEVQEVGLTKETTGVKVQEVDLTEDIGKYEVQEVDITDEHDEVMSSDLDIIKVIIPDLDFTEEPVDFIVPRLHLDELVRKISDSEIKSLKLEGVTVKTGRWDTGEIELLKRNFRTFQSRFGVIDARLLLGIGRWLLFFKHDCQKIKKFLKVKHFNIRLGKDINDRTLYAIYTKARKIFNPLRTEENCRDSDISSIIKLQKKYGNNWNLVGQKLGIQSQICSNLFSWFIKPCSRGSWNDSEINNLIFAVQQVVNSPDLKTVNTASVSWEKVAKIVSTRNSIQCYHKWKRIIKKRKNI